MAIEQDKKQPREVAAFQSLRPVRVDAAATWGAQIGLNLLLPDGTVGTLAKLQALFGGGVVSDSGTISTTDDLEEGQWNLWFTNRRAQDAAGGILADSANVTLTYVGGTSITADLTTITDSGAGALLALTFDAKGRKTGSRAATITGTSGRVTVANGDASAGLPTIDLATVADAGGGALLRFVRDAWGRITGTSAATTDDLTEGATNLWYTDARADARITAQKGVANGLAPLESDGKISVTYLPAAVLGQVSYQGTWDASAGTPPTTMPDKGWYYIVTTAGSTSLSGITDWKVGDWAIYNGSSWDKVDNTDAVVTVNGYTGAVTLTAADVGAESVIAAGTTGQYWRGDKSWQTLDKAAVGLGAVDNTSDVNKPVSTAQAAADVLNLPLDGSRNMTGSINMAGAGANGQIYFSGTPGGANEGYVYTDTGGGLRFFFIIEAANKVVLCNRAANGVLHLRANNATAGGSGESTVAIVSSAGLLAGTDNTKTLGGSFSRWSVVYAATGSINTSDAREKTDVTPLTPDELAAASDLARAIGTYQWLSSLAEKGAAARHHAGLTVQKAIEIMQEHNLDPFSYGFICYDSWGELPEVIDKETGDVTQAYRQAGDRYSFRTDELLLFMARGFDARLSALESKA